MNRLIVSIAALSALFTSLAAPKADAQTAKDLVGTWTLVSSVISKDGTKTDTFGPDPSGTVMFGSDGHYAVIFFVAICRRSRPVVTLLQPRREAQAIARGSIATFGTYTVEDKAIVLRVQSATFPNWNGAEQRRPYSRFGDELTYRSPGTTGVPAQITLRRVR